MKTTNSFDSLRFRNTAIGSARNSGNASPAKNTPFLYYELFVLHFRSNHVNSKIDNQMLQWGHGLHMLEADYFICWNLNCLPKRESRGVGLASHKLVQVLALISSLRQNGITRGLADLDLGSISSNLRLWSVIYQDLHTKIQEFQVQSILKQVGMNEKNDFLQEQVKILEVKTQLGLTIRGVNVGTLIVYPTNNEGLPMMVNKGLQMRHGSAF
ncbi:hypothetical protein R6Q59_014716 [Mikania micrantha]